MRRMTAASDERRISGSVYFGRAAKSVVVVQAHADARGDAAAAARALIGRRLRDLLDLQQRHLVAQRIALDPREPRVDHVANARAPSAKSPRRWSRARCGVRRCGGRRAAAARHRQARVQRQDLDRARRTAGARAMLVASRSAVSRISRSPGRNTRMSPGPSRHRSSAAATIASSSSSSSSASSSPRRRAGDSAPRPDTLRPDTSITGAGCRSAPKWRAKRSASSVAEVTITFRSGRCGSSCFR